jgi:hypothetical protein
MRRKAGQEQKVAEAKPTTFSTWLDFANVGQVCIEVHERDGVRVTVERTDGGFESRSLGEEKNRELHRALSAYMEPREKARLQAEALAKLSPAERWALGLEERR